MEDPSLNGASSFREPDSRTNGARGAYEAMDDKRRTLDGLVNGVAQINGPSALRNGLLTNGKSSLPDGVATAPSEATNPFSQLPPEIEHITFGYLPLSKLITRLVQESFNDLTQVVNDMSAMQISQQPQQSNANHLQNHVNGTIAGASSQANVQKKLRLLNFAQDRRAQFIKLLVLTQWSRQAADVSKAIDLKVWLDRQKGLYDDAGGWMGELKRNLGPAKMPNPDLKTSLEVLSTGKASWLPDLGYIPPGILTPQQMLKTLRNINILLSIRLNLHETIPPQFRTFSIASGRVTFSVANEFDVDLSIADEDPASQLYFIDFRFAFSPSPSELPGGRLRNEIEGKANDVLKKDGLVGCYNFLHDFVLTYKINVLRTQAFDLARYHWTDSLKIEPLHRTLVVQYWLNRPGGKSWLEIGIKSGRRKDRGRVDAEATPYIAVRWFRDGKEVTDPLLIMNLAELSMEAIVQKAIGLHSIYILKSIRDALMGDTLYANETLSLTLTKSLTEPILNNLQVQLTPSKHVTVTIEPLSGTFTLQPTSYMFVRAERDLNLLPHPATDAAIRLANLRWVVAQEEIALRARTTGWELIKGRQIRPEDMERWFPRDTLRVSVFRRKPWRKNWLVACTSSRSGESWWILETQSGGSLYSNNTINGAHLIPSGSLPASTPTSSYAYLSKLENIAAGMISYYVNARYLFHLSIRHTLSAPPSAVAGMNVPLLYIRFSPNVVPLFLRSSKRPVLPWAHEVIKVSFRGVEGSSGRKDTSSGSAILLVEARMVTPIPQITLLTSSVDSSLAFHPSSGAFAFRLLSRVGQPIIPAVLDRLNRIERLIRFLEVLKPFTLKYETISLGQIQFTYSSNPLPLKANIKFATDAPMRISFDKANPHLRIIDFLTNLLNPAAGLEHVTLLLGITLPLLRALDAVEAPRDSKIDADPPVILARSAEWFQIRYANPKCRFDVRLKQRRDEVKWFLSDARSSDQLGSLNQDLENALQALWIGKGEGWFGLRTGVVASVDGVEGLVRKLDALVRSSAVVVDPKTEDSNVAAGAEDRAVVVKKEGQTQEDAVVLD